MPTLCGKVGQWLFMFISTKIIAFTSKIQTVCHNHQDNSYVSHDCLSSRANLIESCQWSLTWDVLWTSQFDQNIFIITVSLLHSPMWNGLAMLGELNSTMIFSGFSVNLTSSKLLNPSRISFSWSSWIVTSDLDASTLLISSVSTSESDFQSTLAFRSSWFLRSGILNSVPCALLWRSSESPGSESFTDDSSLSCNEMRIVNWIQP